MTLLVLKPPVLKKKSQKTFSFFILGQVLANKKHKEIGQGILTCQYEMVTEATLLWEV